MYREFFEEFYDFSDARNYKVTRGVSGVSFTAVNPNITFPTKDLSAIDTDELRVKNYVLNLAIPHSANFTICLVMQLRLFPFFSSKTIKSNFDKTPKKLFLQTNTLTSITLSNSFNGKKLFYG